VRWGIAVGSLLLLSAFVGVAAADDSLIVSAGLDQDVVLGDTVYLDAGGTHAVDGEVSTYDWTIETPEGDAISPDCADCEQTSFQPATTGQYNVTLTARTESGVERADTLYVTVSTYEAAEREVSSSSSGSSSGGGDGCYVSNEANGGMTDDVCSHVGTVLEHDLGGGGDHIDAYIMENEGFALNFDGAEYYPGGKVRVPEESLKYQTDDLMEGLVEKKDTGDTGYNPRDSASSPVNSETSNWGNDWSML